MHALVVITTLLGLWAVPAFAQQYSLPEQPSQGPAPRSYRPTPAPGRVPELPPGSDVQTLPQIAPQSTPEPPAAYQPPPVQAQPSPPAYQAQPVLPAIFRGCWQGNVRDLDSIIRLPGAPPLGYWTTKTYRLCYRRIGNGPFVLTFTQAGMEQNDIITDSEGRMNLLSSNGRSYASMRSDLHFDEYRGPASFLTHSTAAIDEVAMLDCQIEADGMHVTGRVFGRHDGVPWFRARWHTVFVHVGEPPRQVAAPPGGIPE
ncbi:MAG TPA: hypothetical protein VJN94_00910 [Candidatus Binataceae bacterium]|nr:hypothetical protein [Candidatus Binataceae bacterium]